MTGARIAAVIFDMDGVLVDTEPLYFEVNLDVFARLGIDVPDEEHLSLWACPRSTCGA